MKRSGTTDLPLHGGRVPVWLADRMAKLGRSISETILLEFGPGEYIKRLSDPHWFQALGCVMGMDWHSSGITTSVLGALKKSMNPIAHQTGIYFSGGRGRHSKKTPEELRRICDKTGLDGPRLIKASKLSAKVDNTAVQDGHQIYLHSFILSNLGEWAVVQQGMNAESGWARRYHWHSGQLHSFVNEPHTAILGENQGQILNLVHWQADQTRNKIVEVSKFHPEKLITTMKRLKMPKNHEVLTKDVNLRRLGALIALVYDSDTSDFESLLLFKGMGPRSLQSLALVSEVIFGTPTRFEDPARFSFAHGGKDGHPTPVPVHIYDQTIDVLDKIVQKSKIGRTEKVYALKRLHKKATDLEKGFKANGRFNEFVEKEKRIARKHCGRTVFDNGQSELPNDQLSLF